MTKIEQIRENIDSCDKAIELGMALGLDNPANRDALAVLWQERGHLLSQLDDTASLGESLNAYEKAIELRAPLDLSISSNRDNLATCWSDKGFLLRRIGDAASLLAGLAAYDMAIELRGPLDLDNQYYRDNLSICWRGKGLLLEQEGDRASLLAGLAAYDTAIELMGTSLDLDNPYYRDTLAIYWRGKGDVLRHIGDTGSLHASLNAYEKAIELCAPLDLDNPRYRDNLATCWRDKGFLLRQIGDAASLLAGLAALDMAIELRNPLDLDNPDHRHSLSICWRDKGILLRDMGDAPSLQASLAAFDEAIELLASLDLDDPHHRTNLAICWGDKGELLRQMGDTASLRIGLTAFDEAIELRASLDLDNPHHRDNLASCWRRKGLLLSQMGEAESLEASLAAYDMAIKLRAPLDLNNSNYRDELATCWRNKGILLTRMRHAASLRDSLKAFDHAIELRSSLDLDNPHFRDELASCWHDKGFSLMQIGDAASLRDGLVAYDKAIQLRAPLNVDNPRYRHHLAMDWCDKGFLLGQIGDPASLRDGIAAYDKAIEVRELLDLNNPTHRDNLALCWATKGYLLLKMDDAASMRDSLVANQKAIGLREPLDLDNPTYRYRLAVCWGHRGVLLSKIAKSSSDFEAASLAFEKANDAFAPLLSFPIPFHLEAVRDFSYTAPHHVYLKLRLQEPEAAADLCDQALETHRNLERLGLLDRRHSRETLFRLALHAYRSARALGVITEVIMDDLDPRNPGSAADSVAMHEAANETLKYLFEYGASRIAGSESTKIGLILQRTLNAQRALNSIRVKNFAGSATFARLSAEQERLNGRVAEAGRILDRQIEYRPTDPEGYFIRGEFLLLRGQRLDAEQDFLIAGRLAIQAGARDVEKNAPHLAQLAATLLRVKLQDLAANPAILAAQNRAALSATFDDLLTWLERKLPESWIEGLDEEYKQSWRRELPERLREQWQAAASLRTQFFEKQDQELRQLMAQQLAEQIERGRGALALFPQLWRDFVDDIMTAFSAAIRAAAAEPAEFSPDFVLETLETALQRASSRLSVADLAAELVEIGKIMPVDLLEESELRYLACTLRCQRDPVMAKFAALELGCAVEWSIVNRFLAPLRTAHLQHGLALPPPAERDAYLGNPVFSYLKGEAPKFYLGHFVGTIGKIAERFGLAPEDDLFATLAAWLAARPNGQTLLVTAKENWSRRKAALNQLEKSRNAAAHPGHDAANPPDDSDINELWYSLVEDADDAFFRYFPAIFKNIRQN